MYFRVLNVLVSDFELEFLICTAALQTSESD